MYIFMPVHISRVPVWWFLWHSTFPFISYSLLSLDNTELVILGDITTCFSSIKLFTLLLQIKYLLTFFFQFHFEESQTNI